MTAGQYRPDLQQQVLQSTLSQFPVIGSQLHQDLTPADRRTYTKRVKAERVKASQRVSVKFGDLNHKATRAP